MSNPIKSLFIAGGVLTVAGSFLPWRVEGDPIPYFTYGLRVSPSTEDNGGYLVLILSLLLLILVFRAPPVILQPRKWTLALASALVVLSAVHIGSVLLARAAWQAAVGTVGAPLVQVGLVMVSAGSVLLLVAALIPIRTRPS